MNNFVSQNISGRHENNNCHLERERLNTLLRQAFKKPVVTVVAGAGFGKTHAVTAALAGLEHSFLWLQLTPLDNLIARFWERFSNAFEGVSPGLAESLRLLTHPTNSSSMHQFLKLLEDELEKKEHFIIALDDFHTIQNDCALTIIEALITAELPNLTVLLLSRTKPPYNLTAFLSRRTLARIGEDDLRFTLDEMRDFYALQGTPVSEDTLCALYSYTEGWIFAAYLLGLSLQKHNTSPSHLISYAKIDIYELIEQEIFNPASKELQSLLIKSSIFDLLPASLLHEFAQGNRQLIQELHNINLLIKFDAATETFRFHTLLKTFLKEKTHLLNNNEIIQTHFTAASWYHRNNHLMDAVFHYRECGKYKEIFSIILLARNQRSPEVNESFINLIDEAPPAVLEAMPIMKAVRANSLFLTNRIPQAKEYLTQLEAEYQKMPQTPENLSVLGEVSILLAIISILNQTLEFVRLFKTADACLPQGSALGEMRVQLAEGVNICGIKAPVPGELEKFREALFEAAPYAARALQYGDYGMEYLNAADAALMTGDLANVEKHAYEAIYRANSHHQFDIEFMAYFYLVRFYIAKGNYSKILQISETMREHLQKEMRPTSRTLYDVIEGWLFVKLGKPQQVAPWIMDENETRKLLAPVVVGREYLVRSECLLAEERYFELLAFMRQQDEIYESRGILYAQIQNEITRSIIYHYTGEHEESLAALERAYALSSPNNLVFQYIEYGAKMRTVINAARQNTSCTIPKSWLDTIYTKSNTYAKMLAKIIASFDTENQKTKEQILLTKREKEVLNFLCSGLTRDEIALECELSPNTVKSILQNIYSKMGAANAIDAVRIATILKLV